MQIAKKAINKEGTKRTLNFPSSHSHPCVARRQKSDEGFRSSFQ